MGPVLTILRAGESALYLAPAIGGGIARLTMNGGEILRPATAAAIEASDPLGLAEFPMAPFVNRVAAERFAWGEREIALEPATPDAPEILHGTAWRRPWAVVAADTASATLEHVAVAEPAWPFPFRVRRRFALEPARLAIETEFVNIAAGPAPAAIGSHPFFQARGAILGVSATGVWTTSDGIPVNHEKDPVIDRLRAGAAVETLALDHCFTGWDGRVQIASPGGAIVLTAEPNPGFLQIYTPPGEDFFCVEPQTAMPDALNRAPAEGGIRRLAPGETLRLRVALEIA